VWQVIKWKQDTTLGRTERKSKEMLMEVFSNKLYSATSTKKSVSVRADIHMKMFFGTCHLIHHFIRLLHFDL
jgi:hypothetical protein